MDQEPIFVYAKFNYSAYTYVVTGGTLFCIHGSRGGILTSFAMAKSFQYELSLI